MTTVFSGTNLPQMMFPPAVVRRGNPVAAGGYVRNPSSMQAVRYSSVPTELIVISDCVAKLVRIRVVTLARMAGF